MSLERGVLRAVFQPCVDQGDYCDDTGLVYYRQSSDGINWSDPERASPKKYFSTANGVGFAGHPIIVYEGVGKPDYSPILFSRTRDG